MAVAEETAVEAETAAAGQAAAAPLASGIHQHGTMQHGDHRYRVKASKSQSIKVKT